MTRAIAVVVLAVMGLARDSVPPVAAIWYRGIPAGTPRAADLAEIRGLGFGGATWPLSQKTGLAEFQRLATAAGLLPIVRADPVPLTSALALHPLEFTDVPVGRIAATEVAALVWRAVAHGARVISFDAGATAGSGVGGVSGRRPAWLADAQIFARQVLFNGEMIDSLRPASPRPPVLDSPVPASLDLAWLETLRSWVIIATNTSGDRVHAVAHLQAGLPYAMWVNLLDNQPLAMLSEKAGPKWTIDLEPWGVRVYFIDKAIR